MLMPARARLNKYRRDIYRLSNVIICSPEEAPAPWSDEAQLLLIHRQRDYQGVERYITSLAYGGILLIHHYAISHEVQLLVDKLLATSHFHLIAQSGDLIALEKKN
jgi:hypothetical protein